jgi:uncharacterized membrane protein
VGCTIARWIVVNLFLACIGVMGVVICFKTGSWYRWRVGRMIDTMAHRTS